MRARSCPCTCRACKSSLMYTKNVYANYFSVKIISELENYLYCSLKRFFRYKINVCLLNPPYFLSAALNQIACTSIRLIFFLNKTACQNPHSERSEVSAKLSCVAQISLCSRQSSTGINKTEQRLYILS